MEKSVKQVDLFIIGAGIAGLTAALYGSRMKLNTFVLENALVGGQIRNAHIVENYPGFSAIKGSELVEHVRQQAVQAGAIIDEFDQAVKVTLSDKEKFIETETSIYQTKAVIIASGTKRRELPVTEEKYLGRGIHYCELCDGPWYDGKTVAVVGGGSAAVGAVEFLTKYANKIYLIHRSPQLTAEKLQQERLGSYSNVEILLNSVISKINGEEKVESVVVDNTLDKRTALLKLDGIFVNIGSIPRTDLFREFISVSQSGHIIAGETCETNITGVYTAGDVRTKPFRQLTTAASDGTVAALMAEKYILSQQ
ncbi:FAD-dependent oxidoreductase [Sporomusa sphaeroides DSM 2875]|uniref:NAD(P)/FAD-dependent oxidoreductase n=1 Tax=Sporomusa sphaeroides TaxID=47679 RepID=UPI00202DDCD4|nr:FAD-dependent oxidoreductase [Sporomusa sphaeroides]MCM0757758.1 FAD-dependent oxidoreductase [Sporomusa sphaeroides DSM 2875]